MLGPTFTHHVRPSSGEYASAVSVVPAADADAAGETACEEARMSAADAAAAAGAVLETPARRSKSATVSWLRSGATQP